MMQQINLYQIDTQKKFEFTFKHLLLTLGAFLTIIAVITVYDAIKYFSVKKELTQLEREQLVKDERLKAITEQTPEDKARNEIITEIKNFQVERQEKQEMLSILEATKSISHTNFSKYFEALASNTVQGAWLTRIDFKDHGNFIVLQGKALETEYVTRLISKLTSEPPFQGKTFQLFKLSLDEKTKQVDFVLQTESSEKSKKS